MKNIFVFYSSPFNLTNLPQVCYMLSRDDFFEPCIPKLDSGHINCTLGRFVLSLLDLAYPEVDKNTSLNTSVSRFRNIDWQQAHDVLANHLLHDRKVIFASNSIEQIQWLKTQYGSAVVTVACGYDYDTEDYVLFCRWLAMDHVKKQKNNTIGISDWDRSQMEQGRDMVDYYTDHFYQSKFIASGTCDGFDFVIPIADLFNRTKFFQHLDHIDGPVLSSSAQTFYDRWFEHNNIKENKHENQ